MDYFDVNFVAGLHQARRLPVAVTVVCAFCQSTVRDQNGNVVTTRDRAKREGDCGDPICIAVR